MILDFLKARKRPAQRIRLDQCALAYAIGDVHGQLDQLVQLEAQIVEDAAQFDEPATLVMLGDYVDRGPDSAGVIAHLIAAPPAEMRRLAIRGNHEAVMLDFLAEPDRAAQWLDFGGIETLHSYGVTPDMLQTLAETPQALQQGLAEAIPASHLAFLTALPVMVETPDFVFVHAGLRPGIPIAAQRDEDLIWIRDNYRGDFAEFGKIIVHGHTPREAPLVGPHRIAIDTGAFATGRLTGVRLVPGEPPRLFST